MTMRAWRVRCSGVVSIVAEMSASRARAAVIRCARDAGYRPCYTDVRAIREPRYDGWARSTRWRVRDEDAVIAELLPLEAENQP